MLRTIDAALDDTISGQTRRITLRDTADVPAGYGMIMVFRIVSDQKAIVRRGFVGTGVPSFPPDELMRRYGSLLLIYQPSERWLYNSGTEILGVPIQDVAGTMLRRIPVRAYLGAIGDEGYGIRFSPKTNAAGSPPVMSGSCDAEAG